MAGPQQMVAQQSAIAEVKTLLPREAERVMSNAVIVLAGQVRAITLVVPLMEKDKYLVVKLPDQTVKDLIRSASTQSKEKRQAFITDFIAKNQQAMVAQHIRTGEPSRFTFKVIGLDQAATPMAPIVTPRRVEAQKPQPVKVPQPQPTVVPRRATPQPAEVSWELSLPPRFKGGKGLEKEWFVIQIPVPSKAKPGSTLINKDFVVRVPLSRGSVPVSFRLNFTASRGDSSVQSVTLATAIAKIAADKVEDMARKQSGGNAVGISITTMKLVISNQLARTRHPDVQKYISW
jgi:hypothetical protein